MNKDTKIILGVILFIAIVLVAVGYAGISSVNLNIDGSATATPEQTNFTVEFTGTPTTSGDGVTTATINSTDKTKATINVTGLTAAGETATATYTIKNTSADLSATLSVVEPITNSNTEYFDVTYNIATPTTVTAQGETTITVTVELKKTPVTQDETTTIGIQLKADPVQP